MSEFLNRIDLQREVIQIVNGGFYKFQLSGLSLKAIEKWKDENQINNSNKLLDILKVISGKLYFLSNKSQEQITEEYKSLSIEVAEYVARLKLIIVAQ